MFTHETQNKKQTDFFFLLCEEEGRKGTEQADNGTSQKSKSDILIETKMCTVTHTFRNW